MLHTTTPANLSRGAFLTEALTAATPTHPASRPADRRLSAGTFVLLTVLALAAATALTFVPALLLWVWLLLPAAVPALIVVGGVAATAGLGAGRKQGCSGQQTGQAS